MATKLKALITGGSGGIGLALGEELKERGYNLYINSRSQENLNDAAETLGIPIEQTFAADLADPKQRKKFLTWADKVPEEFDCVINNAGVGAYGSFAEQEFTQLNTMLQLNMVALTEITQHFVKRLRTVNRGRILNVASIVAYVPAPQMAAYAATKSYVLALDQALAAELKNTDIQIATLCPGATDSNFFAEAGVDGKMKDRVPKMSTGEVAKIAIEELMKGSEHIVPGASNKAGAALASVMPGNWLASMVGKFTVTKSAAKH